MWTTTPKGLNGLIPGTDSPNPPLSPTVWPMSCPLAGSMSFIHRSAFIIRITCGERISWKIHD
ncbi:unnamed protein product [Oppiella nova]|uniref:Uncharacterized protein n=1 Tax=Oppiella nova TaxID=334625 RepID=A0A7R9MPZ2_9ACAR|nr:unnamed protein product [Oppiella nova]CAG2181067.1 unnamed protein product [Oppiella nova]